MQYFRKFPKISYKFGSNTTSDPFVDLSAYADIIESIKDDSTVYTYYNIKNGERPDIVSSRLYNTPVYDWTFWLLNDHINQQGWPLSYQDFRTFLTNVLPGRCIVFNNTTDHPSIVGETSVGVTGKFAIGTTLTGLTSGASGVVYMRNPNLSQIFVTQTTDTAFISGETIRGSDATGNTVIQDCTSSMLSYNAIHHYLDENENYVDIDPSIEDVPINITPITHEEYLESENDNLSKIKIFKAGVVNKFAALHTESLKA